MSLNQHARASFILFPLLMMGIVANAIAADKMDIPYTPPIDMMQTGHPQAANPEPKSDLYGQVKETMDSGGYTYVLLDTGNKDIWAAGPITSVTKGDAVRVTTDMPMQNFYSKSLKRHFDLIYFSSTIDVAGGAHAAGVTGMDPHHAMPPKANAVSLSNIKKAKNGKTIAEIYSERKQLAGKQVRVRGKVMKIILNIFGKNWLHIQDGSSQQDLLVITADNTQADVVLVKGTVVLDKDNGIGHVYPVVIDNASIIEK